jgi:hypothetical protein
MGIQWMDGAMLGAGSVSRISNVKGHSLLGNNVLCIEGV